MDVEDCPFSEENEHYPHEGNVTRHKCNIKPKLELQCDHETADECVLFLYYQENEDLKEFLDEWARDLPSP